jgi:hypothetical protein
MPYKIEALLPGLFVLDVVNHSIPSIFDANMELLMPSLGLLFVPILGPILYFVIGRKTK